MPEKSISGRKKETLIWIQRQQKTNGLGMVEFSKIPDQNAASYLLRIGDVFEPQPGMIKSATELENEEADGPEFSNHFPWVWKTPKPKNKKNKPEPYEFLAYPDWNVLPSVIAETLRGMGFSGSPFLYEGYSYRKIGGGALRRKMIGSHSKEALIAELKLCEDKNDEDMAKLITAVEKTVAENMGRYKESPEVQVCSDIVFYPKDGSFSFLKK
jgi:hypothetical protein